MTPGAISRQPVRDLPVQITLYVAFPCNLRCKNCYLYGIADDYDRPYMGTPDRDIMSLAVFRHAMDPLLDAGVNPTVCMMGGEPTLHPQLPEMISYIKSRGSSYIDTNTNGTRLEACGAALIEAGIDGIFVSLDGSNPAVNDAGRGNGTFARAIRGLEHVAGLRAASGRKLKLAINHTVTRANYHDVVDMARLGRRLGIDELFVNLTIFVRRDEGIAAQRALEPLGLHFESWKGFVIDRFVDGIDTQLLRAQLEELTATDWGGMNVFLAPVGYSPAELVDYFSDSWDQRLRETACPIQTFRTTVLPNGDVIPCTIYPDIVLGNLREASLHEVWHGEAYSRFRALVTRRLLPTCKRCCDLFDETKGDPYAFVNESRLQYRVDR